MFCKCSRVPIRIRDIIDEGLSLEARCHGCGKVVIWHGQRLLAPLGMHATLTEIAQRLVCSRCRMPAALILRMDDTEVRREAHRRGLSVHIDRTGHAPDPDPGSG